MGRTNKTHQTIRRLLLLPAEAPQRTPYRIEGNRLIFLEGEERRAEIDAWDKEGWRGELASSASYWIRKFYHPKELIEAPWNRLAYKRNNRKTKAALAKTKHLELVTPYIHPKDTSDVEGYLIVDGDEKQSWPVVLIATYSLAKNFLQLTDKDDPEKDKVVYIASDDLMPFYGEKIFVNSDKLDDEIIKQAISDWYMDKYRFQRGHSSRYRKVMPEIKVTLEWE